MIILYFVILATALPAGWLLAWLCDDEIVKDRKWFLRTALFLAVILVFLVLFFRNIPAIFSITYLIIILLLMSYRNKIRRLKNN